jgi:hypothetical protein
MLLFSMMAITVVYIMFYGSMIASTANTDLQSSARLAMYTMARDIRWGRRIVPGYSGYTTSDSTIVLQVPSINAQEHVIDVTQEHDYIIYRLAGDGLERIVYPKTGVSFRNGGTRRVSGNVDTLVFKNTGSPLSTVGDLSAVKSVEIELKVSKPGRAGEVSEQLATTIELRNHS